MTTTIKVEAHCSENQEVRVNIHETTEGGESNTPYVLQNGETGTYYVHDNRELTVKEVDK